MTTGKEQLLVVSHTHWDREWYRTAEQFRIALLSLVDEVVERGRPFLLDGQAIVLDDCESWRPELAGPLGDRLRARILEAGPWYVLADNLIPSGEALVRNLLAGRRALGQRGASPPGVLYCPDTFGHPASGPTLAAGFGMPLAIVWRGYGGRGWPAGDAARWRSVAGDEVQLYHLPPSGYEHGASLPVAPDEAAVRWAEIRGTLRSRASLPTLLVLNGADHHAPQPSLDRALALGQEALPGCTVRASTLSAFVSARSEEGSAAVLPAVQGELRASPSYVWALQGTFGTRAAQKRTNALLERLLVREVEPWMALAWWKGGTPQPSVERAVWLMVLESHPHDTLCGCSIDAVALAMDDRMRRARDVALELRRQTVERLLGIDPDAMRERFGGTDRSVVVTNPVARPRSGVVEVEVDLPLADVAVGPGSGVRQVAPRAVPAFSVGTPPLPMQRLESNRVIARHESPHHYPRVILAHRERVLVWVAELPAYGTVVLPVVERRSRPRSSHRVEVLGGVMQNGHLAVWCDLAHGLRCAREGREITDLLGFETVGDRGDLYTHSAVPGTHVRGTLLSSRITMRGPLRAELILSFGVPAAARRVVAATGEPLVRRAAMHRVEVRVQLDAGSRWLRVVVEGDNAMEDQRLRVVFRTGGASHTHLADAAFGAIERSSDPPAVHEGGAERLAPTAPLHRHVSLFDRSNGHGATVVSDGLAEYEADPSGQVAVTLLRSVGELSRVDLPERPGHAGWPSSTPGAQSPGPWRAVMAFMPHGADTAHTRRAIEACCEDVLVPPTGSTTVARSAATDEGLALEGDAVSFLACKRSEDGQALVVRCLNRESRAAPAAWVLPGLGSASLARLDETPLGALPVTDNRVRFEVPPHAVSTVLLRRRLPTS